MIKDFCADVLAVLFAITLMLTMIASAGLAVAVMVKAAMWVIR